MILRGRDEETPHQARKRRTSDFRGIVSGLRFLVVLTASSRVPRGSLVVRSSVLPAREVSGNCRERQHFLEICARFASGLRSPFRLKINAYTRMHTCVTVVEMGEKPRQLADSLPTVYRQERTAPTFSALIPILCPRSPQRSGHTDTERQGEGKHTAEKEKPTQRVFEGLRRACASPLWEYSFYRSGQPLRKKIKNF